MKVELSDMATPETPHRMKSAGRYILIGTLTAAPLAITWFILEFLFGQLARVGRPWVTGFARSLSPEHPVLAAWLQNETFLSVMAAFAYFARFGQRFRAILGTRFTPSWAAISRMRAG